MTSFKYSMPAKDPVARNLYNFDTIFDEDSIKNKVYNYYLLGIIFAMVITNKFCLW